MTLTEEQKAEKVALAALLVDLQHHCDAHSQGSIRIDLSEVRRLLAALEAAQSANRPRDDYPVFCSDCGRAHVLDTVLPSEIWNKIASPDDLLCVVCIDTRLKKAGLTAEAEFYYSGDALRSRLYGDADALEACGTTEAIEAVAASLSGTPSPIPGDTTK